jgi:glycyl-tRNA synthetase
MKAGNERTFFKFPKNIAPYRVGIFPLVKKDGITEKAREISELMKGERIHAFYDQSGSIGKRYARSDEIGIPECITIDYDTLKDNTVTVRNRDTKKQSRVRVSELSEFLKK